jgi:hypothetical protein
MSTQNTKYTCDWPSCSAESDQPFTDGWAVCDDCDDLLPGLSGDGALFCPTHKEALEDLIINKPPPTNATH